MWYAWKRLWEDRLDRLDSFLRRLTEEGWI